MRSALALAFALGGGVASAAAQEEPEIEPARLEGAAPWGTIRQVMEPPYP